MSAGCRQAAASLTAASTPAVARGAAQVGRIQAGDGELDAWQQVTGVVVEHLRKAMPWVHGGGAWDSSWYATAEFGHMQSGTGILLDMGRGKVRLALKSPASARYVLIWFTRLPAKSPGKYQVSLYKATVDGHA